MDQYELIDKKIIVKHTNSETQKLANIIILDEISSTNQYLIENNELPSGSVCIAETQTAGRGRRGREWISPFGASIYLSLLWHFSNLPLLIEGLSIVVGISVIRALQKYGIKNIGIKWPNDILFENRKLAGILVELSAHKAIIGIGVNLNLPGQIMIDQPWIDLQTILKERPRRNELIGYLLDELFLALSLFEKNGFSFFHQTYKEYDLLQEKLITIISANENVEGVAKGIDEKGQLMVNSADVLRSFNSGEVSVRTIT